MKQTAEQLVKTFTVEVDEAKDFIELKFVSKDVGKENIDIQSDLISKAIFDVFEEFPEKKDWKVLVDTATTKVHSMNKYSMKNYEELISHDSPQKIAILVDDTDKQAKIASFVLGVLAKVNKKVSVFTSEAEAKMWLNF
jgi:hypothetical protein